MPSEVPKEKLETSIMSCSAPAHSPETAPMLLERKYSGGGRACVLGCLLRPQAPFLFAGWAGSHPTCGRFQARTPPAAPSCRSPRGHRCLFKCFLSREAPSHHCLCVWGSRQGPPGRVASSLVHVVLQRFGEKMVSTFPDVCICARSAMSDSLRPHGL